MLMRMPMAQRLVAEWWGESVPEREMIPVTAWLGRVTMRGREVSSCSGKRNRSPGSGWLVMASTRVRAGFSAGDLPGDWCFG